jgi:hypothetical protein
VRHETCRTPGALVTDDQRTTIAAGESLGPFTHHHHTVRCGLCGQWWFNDLARGAFGQPVPARRDTQLCGRLEGQPVYTTVAVYVPGPETSCACTKASVDSYPFQVHRMPG